MKKDSRRAASCRLTAIAAMAAFAAAGSASGQTATTALTGNAPARVNPKVSTHVPTPLDNSRPVTDLLPPGEPRPAVPTFVPPPGGRASDRPPGWHGGGGNGGGDGGVADAGITLLDFEAWRFNDSGFHDIGRSIYEDGFFVGVDGGDAYGLEVAGTQNAWFPGSTAVYNNTVGGTTYVYALNYAPFSLEFMEFSNLANTGPVTVTVHGVKYDGTEVTEDCTTEQTYNYEDTFYFPGFNDLLYIYFTQDTPFHQVDNIGVVRQPIVMDFQGLEQVDANVHDWGTEVLEDGFLIDENPGEPYGLSTYGTQLNGYYCGSTALFDDSQNGVETLTQYGGGSFNVHSIDLSNLNGDQPTSVTFVGTRVGGSTISKTCKTVGNAPELQRFEFAGFNNLVSLTWTQVYPYHQIDNIVLSRGQQTLDFAQLTQYDDQVHHWGSKYRQDGFRLTEGPDDPYEFSTFGVYDSRFAGSTALFNDTAGGLIHLETTDGSQFQLSGIELSTYYDGDAVQVDFVGHRHDGAVLHQSFTTSGGNHRLETFEFDGTWRTLDDVEWVQNFPYHQFDNIRLSRQTTLVDFQKLEHVDANYTYVGDHYTENGFTLSKGHDEPYDFATLGTLEPRYAGSTALANDTIGGITHLAANDGGSFDLLQMDVAELNNYGLGPVTVNFVGTKVDGSQVYQSFTAYDPDTFLQTCRFRGFDSLKYVEWTQDSPFHQFDNIVAVEAAPENTCYPDCDHSGSLDLFDFLCFTNDFNANGSYSNCDGNGTHDLFDFLCYVNAFNAGC